MNKVEKEDPTFPVSTKYLKTWGYLYSIQGLSSNGEALSLIVEEADKRLSFMVGMSVKKTWPIDSPDWAFSLMWLDCNKEEVECVRMTDRKPGNLADDVLFLKEKKGKVKGILTIMVPKGAYMPSGWYMYKEFIQSLYVNKS